MKPVKEQGKPTESELINQNYEPHERMTPRKRDSAERTNPRQRAGGDHKACYHGFVSQSRCLSWPGAHVSNIYFVWGFFLLLLLF